MNDCEVAFVGQIICTCSIHSCDSGCGFNNVWVWWRCDNLACVFILPSSHGDLFTLMIQSNEPDKSGIEINALHDHSFR